MNALNAYESLSLARQNYTATARRAQSVALLLRELANKSILLGYEAGLRAIVDDAWGWSTHQAASPEELRDRIVNRGLINHLGIVEFVEETPVWRLYPFRAEGLTHYVYPLRLTQIGALSTLPRRHLLVDVQMPSFSTPAAAVCSWEAGLLANSIEAQTLSLLNAMRELELGIVTVLGARHPGAGDVTPIGIVGESDGINDLLDRLLAATKLGIAPTPRYEFGEPAQSNVLTAVPQDISELVSTS
jgi:hypothetical protein